MAESVETSSSPSGNIQHVGTWAALHTQGLVPQEWTEPPPSRPAGARWRNSAGYACRLGTVINRKGARATVCFRVTIQASSDERARIRALQRAQGLTPPSGAAALGLEVEHYPPRFTRYSGSSAQLLAAGVLPDNFKMPRPDRCPSGQGFASSDWWKTDNVWRILTKKAVSGDHYRRKDYRPDYWQLTVVDHDHDLSDNIVDLHRAELRHGKGL